MGKGAFVKSTSMYQLPIDNPWFEGSMILAYGIWSISVMYGKGRFEEIKKNMASNPEEEGAEIDLLIGSCAPVAVREKLVKGWKATEEREEQAERPKETLGEQEERKVAGRGTT